MERKQGMKNAKELHMNMSEYIRLCMSMNYPSLIQRVADAAETSNLLNRIFHRLEGYTDSDTLAEIQNYVKDYYSAKKGESHYV